MYIQDLTQVVISYEIYETSLQGFIWNDHKCKIIFIIWPFIMEIYNFQNAYYFNNKAPKETRARLFKTNDVII